MAYVFRPPFIPPARSTRLPFSAPVYVIAGTVYNWPSGNGSGIQVDLINWTTGQVVATTTTAIGGTFQFLVYDPVSYFVCVAVFSATLTGASGEGQAVYYA